MGKGNSQLRESSHALVGIDKLQEPFPKEDAPSHEAEEQYGSRAVSGWVDEVGKKLLHRLLLFKAKTNSAVIA
jgi:hypothetical protein